MILIIKAEFKTDRPLQESEIESLLGSMQKELNHAIPEVLYTEAKDSRFEVMNHPYIVIAEQKDTDIVK